MVSAPCGALRMSARLLASSPPSYLFWHAVVLRLGNASSGHWVQLLQLVQTASLELLLTCVRGLLSHAAQAPILGALDLLLDLCTLSNFLWPALFSIPAMRSVLSISGFVTPPHSAMPRLGAWLQRFKDRSAASVHSGLYPAPSWAVTILVLPTLLALNARLCELYHWLFESTSVAAAGKYQAGWPNQTPILKANAWLRGLCFHLGWVPWKRGSARSGMFVQAPGHEAIYGSDRFLHVLESIEAHLPPALHVHATYIVSLLHEVSFSDRNGKGSLVDVIRNALKPLGESLSSLLSTAALSEHGRYQLARGLDELANALLAKTSSASRGGNSPPPSSRQLSQSNTRSIVSILRTACQLLRSPGLVGLSGIVRLDMPPPSAIRIELRVSDKRTGNRIHRHSQEGLCKVFANLATVGLTRVHDFDPAPFVDAHRVSCSQACAKRNESAVTVLLFLSIVEQPRPGEITIDRFFTGEEGTAILDELHSQMGTIEDAEQLLGLHVHSLPKIAIVSKKKELKLASGAKYEVPLPLEMVERALCEASPAERGFYGNLSDYAHPDLKVEMGGFLAEANIFRCCFIHPVTGACSIVHVENLSIDLLLDESFSQFAVGFEWAEPKRSSPEAEGGRLGALQIKLLVDQPQAILIGGPSSKVGIIGGRTHRPVVALDQPICLRKGRFEADILICLETGTFASRCDPSSLAQHLQESGAGIYWGFNERSTQIPGGLAFDSSTCEVDKASLSPVAEFLNGITGLQVAGVDVVGLIVSYLVSKNSVIVLLHLLIGNVREGIRNQPIMCMRQLHKDWRQWFELIDETTEYVGFRAKQCDQARQPTSDEATQAPLSRTCHHQVGSQKDHSG